VQVQDDDKDKDEGEDEGGPSKAKHQLTTLLGRLNARQYIL